MMKEVCMKTIAFAILGGLLAATSAGANGANVTTYTDSVFVNVGSLELYHPCGANGAGEMVALSGYLHIVIHATLPADGSGNFVQQYNYSGVTAVGATSGDAYRVVGSYRIVQVFDPGDTLSVDTFVANTQIIGKGQTPNARMHSTVHTTFNAAGEITASVDLEKIVCK